MELNSVAPEFPGQLIQRESLFLRREEDWSTKDMNTRSTGGRKISGEQYNWQSHSYDPRAGELIDSILSYPEELLRVEQTDECHLQEVQMLLGRIASTTNARLLENDQGPLPDLKHNDARNRRKNYSSSRWRGCFEPWEGEDGEIRQGILANRKTSLMHETNKDKFLVTRSQSMRYRDQGRPCLKVRAMMSEEAKTACHSGPHNASPSISGLCGACGLKPIVKNMVSNSTEFRRRTTSVPIRRDRRSQSMRVPSSRTQTQSDRDRRHGSPKIQAGEAGEFERMRTFSIDPTNPACIINRGDSFRRRSSACAGLQPRQRCGISAEAINGVTQGAETSTNIFKTSQSRQALLETAPAANLETFVTPPESLTPSVNAPLVADIRAYEIAVVGMEGVGKTSLINQFMTSEYCNPFLRSDGGKSAPLDNTITIQLDGEESRLTFLEVDIHKNEIWPSLEAHGYLVVYSIDDAISFRNAKQFIRDLRAKEQTADKPTILVANKIDLERKRHVTADDGRSVARDHNCKFVEITVGLGHHVDELLVGILTQVKLYEQEILEIIEPPTSPSADDGIDQIKRDPSKSPTSSHPQELNAAALRRSPSHQQHLRQTSTKRRKRGSHSKGSEEIDSISPPTSCTNLTAVGQRFVQKMFGRRRSARSLEDLLSLP